MCVCVRGAVEASVAGVWARSPEEEEEPCRAGDGGREASGLGGARREVRLWTSVRMLTTQPVGFVEGLDL